MGRNSTTVNGPVSLPSRVGDLVWELAALYPPQGEWSEEEYLGLDTNHLIEFSDGRLEFLPMPTPFHQLIVDFLHSLLKAFVAERRLGHVFFAPLPVRLRVGKYREPDVVFVKPARLKTLRGQPRGADLVMEVLSEGEENRKRDLQIKRKEYAAARISEYWIVDPEERTITVLTLAGKRYRVHGKFSEGAEATSGLLKGFRVPVAEVFAVGSEANNGK
jgi:Uma2 family endonuclease